MERFVHKCQVIVQVYLLVDGCYAMEGQVCHAVG